MIAAPDVIEAVAEDRAGLLVYPVDGLDFIPRSGRAYGLQPGRFAKATLRVVVLRVRRGPAARLTAEHAEHAARPALLLEWGAEPLRELWLLTISREIVRAEPPRFMHRDSTHGYTTDSGMAMLGDSGTLSAEDLDWYAQESGQRFIEAQRAQNERLPLAERVRRLEARAAAGEAQAGRELHVIRQRVERAEARTARSEREAA